MFLFLFIAMKITLEVLKERGASEYCISSFLEYCIEKKQTDFNPKTIILEEPDFFHDDNIRQIIYECIDDIEELRALVEYYIEKEKWEMHDVFKYCGKYFKYDLKLFRRAIWKSMHNWYRFDVNVVLEHCREALELIPDFHINLQKYREGYENLRNEMRQVCK